MVIATNSVLVVTPRGDSNALESADMEAVEVPYTRKVIDTLEEVIDFFYMTTSARTNGSYQGSTAT